MMTSGALVMLMIPAICLFYSGASDRSSALIMFRLPFITTAFVGFQVSRKHRDRSKQLLTCPVVSLGLLPGLLSCYCSRLFSMVLVRWGHKSECAPRYRSSTSRCRRSQNSRTCICVSSLHVRIVHVRISLAGVLASAS